MTMVCLYASDWLRGVGSVPCFRNMMMKHSRIGGLYLFRTHPDQPDSEVTVSQALQTQVIAGTPESVVEQLLRFRDEVGPFGTLLYTGHDWADPGLARRSMELMATKVMPRLNEELMGRARTASGPLRLRSSDVRRTH